MATTTSRPSIPWFLLHLFLVLATGGAWLVVLILWYILKEWCEVYDDVPPRNRAETTILDALIEARDQLHAHARKLHPTV